MAGNMLTSLTVVLNVRSANNILITFKLPLFAFFRFAVDFALVAIIVFIRWIRSVRLST